MRRDTSHAAAKHCNICMHVMRRDALWCVEVYMHVMCRDAVQHKLFGDLYIKQVKLADYVGLLSAVSIIPWEPKTTDPSELHNCAFFSSSDK